jgi:hypothetical protein
MRLHLIQTTIAVVACAFIPVLCSAQAPQPPDDDARLAATHTPMAVAADGRWLTSNPDPLVGKYMPPSLGPQERRGLARSFEQLQVFVEAGDNVSVREGSGEEFSARVAGLTATELVVMIDGQRRAFRPDDAIRIRQQRGDSLANGTWLGFGIGAGFALMAAAVDNSGFFDGAGWALLAAGVYGGMGAGIGVGVDALIRGRQVIYDHQPATASTVAIVPVIGMKRAGALVALRF